MSARSTRGATISLDRPWVAILAIVLVMIIMAASYIFSFTAIAQAGTWTGASTGVAWLAAIFIDGPILTYTISLSVKEWRGTPRRERVRTRVFLYAFTATSVALNFAHTASYWNWDFTRMDSLFGCLMAVAAPLAALAASEEVVSLAFTKRSHSPDIVTYLAQAPDVEVVAPPAPRKARQAATVDTLALFDGIVASDGGFSTLEAQVGGDDRFDGVHDAFAR
ncbi:DUF2637 domain-containing protein [Microbacterium ginsengisoli]|nr:DUF2637 domain-containing protein [Microbacteriaceae bacterium K1510]